MRKCNLSIKCFFFILNILSFLLTIKSEVVGNVLRKHFENKKLVAAICAGWYTLRTTII